MRKKAITIERHTRPATKGEAVRLVQQIFDENGWGGRDIAYYLSTLNVPSKPFLTEHTLDELRTILDDFEKAKMILYSTKKGD